MTQDEAASLIYRLDNWEARSRDLEVGMRRFRHELQREFRVKMWDFDPATQEGLGLSGPPARHPKQEE